MTLKMVVTDLDGTLFRSDRTISSYTQEVLNECIKAGFRIIVATARPPRLVFGKLPPEFIDTYVICYNGAQIYCNRSILHKSYIDTDITKNIISWLCDAYPGIKLSLEIENHLFTNFDISLTSGWLPPYTEVDFSSFTFKPAAKILVDLNEIDNLSSIRNMPAEDCIMIVTDNGSLAQIMHRSVSKANAVRHLAELLGSNLKETIAFGDDFNDVELIRECGIGVAMGNSDEEIKLVADIVTSTNDEDGVARVLMDVLDHRL